MGTKMNIENKVGFAIGTGRCGTLFLHQLAEKESNVASSHERNPDNETFHRYCKWHDLPVDHEGFLAVKEKEILTDLETQAYSFEASPHLSLSTMELYERFKAKFILLIRRPDRVVTSFAHKGFYRYPYRVSDTDLATGYQNQGHEKLHNFFARVAPRGIFFEEWNAMSQIGRIAWFWKAWNERTLEILQMLPEECFRIVRIEDLDYAKYVELSNFLGYRSTVTQNDFEALQSSKPHAFWHKRNVDQWSGQEIQEFEGQVGELAERLGYEYRIANLTKAAKEERAEAIRLGHIQQRKKAQHFWRLRKTAANWLYKVSKALNPA